MILTVWIKKLQANRKNDERGADETFEEMINLLPTV